MLLFSTDFLVLSTLAVSLKVGFTLSFIILSYRVYFP